MTSRTAGKRISELYVRNEAWKGSAASGRGNSRQRPVGPKEKRRMAQLVASGLIFVCLVAVKLLLPSRIEWLGTKLDGLMQQNMDVTAVFSAVGRAFSGEETVRETLGDVYQAVFHPEGEATPASAAVSPDITFSPPIEHLRAFAEGAALSLESTGESVSSDAGEGGTADTGTTSGTETTNLSYILYSDETLPANVSLEQEILDFSYCTPVSGTLSSEFGYREHPIEGEEKFHYGIDLAADTGTAIDSFADGTVSAVGESSSYGKYLTVAHTEGYTTLYAHCSKIVVSSGETVKEGQKIAEVGETGLATGPHLHFELHQGSEYLNPIYYVSPV